MATPDPLSHSQFLVSPLFPPELVLKTIQYLPFGNGNIIASLRSTHSRFKDLLDNYEHSITRNFVGKELPHAPTDFPYEEGFNLSWLAQCVRRYDIVDDIMDALFSDKNCFAVERHNLPLVNTGLLLLYRLASFSKFFLPFTARTIHIANATAENHMARITYIKSLQCDPLTAIYLALHHATLSARYHGSGWIHQRTYGRFMDANQLSLRNELEFCFAEAALNVGPAFISDMLLHHNTTDAETMLLNYYHDHGIHDWDWPCWGTGAGEFEPPRTQGPRKEPGSRGRTLFTTLLERMAELIECPLEEVKVRIEQYTDAKDHSLAYLDLVGKARLLQGLDLDYVDGDG
ncbi:Nn.00g015730.m01.CDS01 [Neocucurbitaria sp. VM-36]